ncbi:hypothetical protein QAD02_004303 [Eretmocerus hayati]|uniref:Uncharacterized protein n=1 Tax=Eretmocerus hayati TaxID=131215 RepID=A0ACC2NPJ6_9HYME|nr:hypothetical protein QAD02_004303 [Eretmocerus hayati]
MHQSHPIDDDNEKGVLREPYMEIRPLHFAWEPLKLWPHLQKGGSVLVVGGYVCTDVEENIAIKYRNPCLTGQKTCQNGGTCKVREDAAGGTPSIACSCPVGYTASLCEIKIENACDSSPCANNGTCVLHTLLDYTCRCALGFTGEYCEQIDYCASSPCRNGAQCRSLRDGYQCHCTPGFTGATCAEDVDECRLRPCKYGTCLNTHGYYKFVELTCSRTGGRSQSELLAFPSAIEFWKQWNKATCRALELSSSDVLHYSTARNTS